MHGKNGINKDSLENDFYKHQIVSKRERREEKEEEGKEEDEQNKNGFTLTSILSDLQTKYRLFPPYHLSNAVKSRPTSEGIPEPLKPSECPLDDKKQHGSEIYNSYGV